MMKVIRRLKIELYIGILMLVFLLFFPPSWACVYFSHYLIGGLAVVIVMIVVKLIPLPEECGEWVR